jgi:hypothetical protein
MKVKTSKIRAKENLFRNREINNEKKVKMGKLVEGSPMMNRNEFLE